MYKHAFVCKSKFSTDVSKYTFTEIVKVVDKSIELIKFKRKMRTDTRQKK